MLIELRPPHTGTPLATLDGLDLEQQGLGQVEIDARAAPGPRGSGDVEDLRSTLIGPVVRHDRVRSDTQRQAGGG